MKNLRSFTTRSLIALSVMGMGLVLAAQPASAAPITFIVHEDPAIIPGVVDNTFDADNITGKYAENLVLGPGDTFSATLLVEFASYADGGALQGSQLNGLEAVGGYAMYAEVVVSGTFTSSPHPDDPATFTLFSFSPDSSTATIFIDPNQIQGDADDFDILTASLIDLFFSSGQVKVVTATGDVVEGSFALVYTDASVSSPEGAIYWPTLAGFTLRATTSGDVDPPSSITTGEILGDVSLSFEREEVPEPTSMALFGLALLGSGIAARRRRVE